MLIEGRGFTVISTENADRFDYTNTVIQVSQDVPEKFVEELKSALIDSYELSDVRVISDTEDPRVDVIIGSSKK